MKKHIPNFLTCCNLICGSLGVIYILNGWNPEGNETQYIVPAYFVWAACVFDFFDGFAARALKVSSPIGKELDSLADMVSFGLLPGLFMYTLMGMQADETWTLLPYAALTIVVFSALRLAIFNVDETQKDSFRGLPTPANALFITAIPYLNLGLNNWLLLVITILFSFLLVSRIDLFALKFKSFAWGENKIRFVFLILSGILLIVFKQAAIPLIIILYIVLSLSKRAFA
jgi:CDP-diacylglycerol---serine O-phosphatidyltransferase